MDSFKFNTKKEENEKEIEQKLEEYHYLINKEQAKYLVSIEKSKDYFKPKNIIDAKKSLFPFELEAEVKKVYLLQKISKNNQTFISLRILIDDGTDQATVVFFDAAALEVWQKIMTGDKILIGPLKNFNDEFRLLSQGKIRIIKKARTISNPENGMIGNFEGKAKNIVDKQYKTKNGEKKIMSFFYTDIDNREYRVVLWESNGLKNILKDGTSFRIENGYVKNNEIWLKSNSRLLFKPFIEKKVKIKNFLFEQNKVIIESEKGRILFNMLDLAALLGMQNLAPDIDLKKILEIKLFSMIGKELPSNYKNYTQGSS